MPRFGQHAMLPDLHSFFHIMSDLVRIVEARAAGAARCR
jgi:hypothetical protein